MTLSSRPDCIACEKHYGNLGCCPLCGKGAGREHCYDHVYLHGHQLGSEGREQIELLVGRSDLEMDVLPLDIAEFAQAIAQLRPH